MGRRKALWIAAAGRRAGTVAAFLAEPRAALHRPRPARPWLGGADKCESTEETI